MTHAPHIPGHHDNSWQLYVMCLQACFLAEFRFLNLFDHIPWMLFSYGCLECLLSSFNNQTYIILIILLHLLVLDAISRCCHTKSAWRFVHVRMKKRFKPRVVFSVSPCLPREKCMQTYHKSIQWCCKSISAFTSSFPRRFSAML